MSNLIYKKMVDVMKDIGAIGKNQKNTQQGFKFRGIDDMLNNLYPALTKHGVFMTTSVLEATQDLREVVRSSGKTGTDKHVSIKMQYTFYAEDGSSVSSSVPAEGLDSGDKATNKALSAALKYALIQTFSIPTEDMEEGDKVSPEMGVSAKSSVKTDTFVNGQSVTVVSGSPVNNSLSNEVSKVDSTPKSKTTFRKAKPITTETKPLENGVVVNTSVGLNF